MSFGSSTLAKGAKGSDVEELQIRLAGFRGTIWDGDFGPGTELQVLAFQRDYMKMENLTGVVEEETFQALRHFAEEYTIDFEELKCACGECGDFGQDRFKGEYRAGKPEVEAYHRREYPGIHQAILHAYRAAQFYAEESGFDSPSISCGYRCWIHNQQKGRESTNHMGKAIDFDFFLKEGEDKRDDCNRCDAVRAVLVEKCNFQIGWGAHNMKSLEPSRIAPSWIHMDVRCYSPQYLADRYFVKSIDEPEGNGP